MGNVNDLSAQKNVGNAGTITDLAISIFLFIYLSQPLELAGVIKH